jgi:ParB-like chromosome segregation protein Spo0J
MDDREERDEPLARLGTTLARARCVTPAQVERSKQSMSAHGQLTAVVARRASSGGLELIDGFKRLAAAGAMGWTTLRVSTVQVDEVTQWAMMLALNRGPQTMTELEEALVLRELSAGGMTQVEMGQLLGRHKSWVSRRIGLLERLHPELVQSLRLGLLRPGVARRLMVLPAGNQLEMAAVAQRERFGPHETERWVSLWRGARDAQARRYVMTHPREALEHADPTMASKSAMDPRLTMQGQRLFRLLRIVASTACRARELLTPPPATGDLAVLASELRATADGASALVEVLGSVASVRDGAGKTGSVGT